MYLINIKIVEVALFAMTTVGLVVAAHPKYVSSVGAESIIIEDFPFLAMLKLNDNSIICLGTIVNKLFILTSGLCTMEISRDIRDYSVHVGTSATEERNKVYALKKIILHEKYFDGDINYNIGLLKVAKPLTFGPTVEAATLARKGLVMKKGMEFNATGNFYVLNTPSVELKRTKVSFVSHAVCQKAYNNFEVTITQEEVCVLAKKSDEFYAERGSPLVLKGLVVGLSLSYQDCHTVPGVYLKIAQHEKWIKREIAKNS